MASELGLSSGTSGLVIKDIAEDSAAFEKGLRAGDVITEAGQQSVAQVSDLEDQISAAKDAGRKSVLLLIRRGGEPRFLALPIED